MVDVVMVIIIVDVYYSRYEVWMFVGWISMRCGDILGSKIN